jgi:hypothetical protein
LSHNIPINLLGPQAPNIRIKDIKMAMRIGGCKERPKNIERRKKNRV